MTHQKKVQLIKDFVDAMKKLHDDGIVFVTCLESQGQSILFYDLDKSFQADTSPEAIYKWINSSGHIDGALVTTDDEVSNLN